jgi:D-threo-aldose 1-dehydrogenase
LVPFFKKGSLPLTPVPFTRGLSVSPLAFGSAEIGNLHRAVSEQQAQQTLHAAADSGVTLFDTAPAYGNGLSELRLGQFLRSRPRTSYVLSTKVGNYMVAPSHGTPPGRSVFASPLPFEKIFDYTYDGTMRALEQSRLRLGLLRPDIVFIHDLDRRNHGNALPEQMRIAQNGACRALDELRRSGDIGAAGIAVNEADTGAMLLGEWNFDCALLAGCYTLLDQTADASFLPAARKAGIPVIAASVFHSGILAGGATFNYAAPAAGTMQRVRMLDALCARHEIPLAALALQFAARRRGIASVVVGASRPETISRSAAALMAAIPDGLWEELAASNMQFVHSQDASFPSA